MKTAIVEWAHPKDLVVCQTVIDKDEYEQFKKQVELYQKNEKRRRWNQRRRK